MLAVVREHSLVYTSRAIGVFTCSRRQIARVKAIKRNATFDAEALRNTDMPLIIQPNLALDTESDK